MGKKPIVSVTYESERISIKMCVTSLRSCVVHGPIYGFLWQPLYREKTVAIKTHKTAINQPVDHTGET